MDIQHILAWFKNQNWFVTIPVVLGYLNVVVAGAKVMGWMQLANFCGKLEDAFAAMIQAALNKNKGVENVKTDSPVGVNGSGDTGVKPS